MTRQAWQTMVHSTVVIAVVAASFGAFGGTRSGMAQAKRSAPEPVTPIVHHGIRYVVPRLPEGCAHGQRGGCVQAWDVATNTLRWTRMVYSVRYEKGLESDVQDVFITGLQLVDGKLVVDNELGERFEMDPTSGEVVARVKQSSRTALPTKQAPEK